MTETTSTRSTTQAARVVRRRRGLPGSRAVVGALLVVAAAVGTFAAYLSATAPPTDEWITAVRPIARGEILQASDLAIVLADVPPAQAATILRGSQLADVVGTTAAVPIGQGAFLLGSMVQPVNQLEGELFTFSLPAERALGGQVVDGTTIDMIATYGGGASAETVYIVRGVAVTRAGGAAGSLGGGSAIITVLLPDPLAVQRVAHALGNAQVWLVRSGADTGVPPPYSFQQDGAEPARDAAPAQPAPEADGTPTTQDGTEQDGTGQ